MIKQVVRGTVLAAALLVGTAASACPPPAPVEVARLPDESDEAYYDRLVAGSWPNSWRAQYAQRPTQEAGESDADFAARLATWMESDRRASQAAYERAQARRRAAAMAEESARWQSPQILLVESLGSRDRGEFAETRFRVIDRLGDARRHRTVTLRFPMAQTSCDASPPRFTPGTRWVLFAGNGTVTNANLIGFYDLQTAQDPRTRQWLEGTRPDGTPRQSGRP